MVAVQFDPEIEARLERLAAETKVTADFVVHEAVERFLEDREDYLAGIRAKSSAKYIISQEEMERRANLAD